MNTSRRYSPTCTDCGSLNASSTNSVYWFSIAVHYIDHDILITRLSSWFGVHGSVLCWFKCYNHLTLFVSNVITSVPCTVPVGVFPKALFLALYFSSFSSCTLPLSVIIITHNADLLPFFGHHYYADDTQLFFSFHLLNFDLSTSHLHNALQQISSRMTANLIALNFF